MPVEPLVDNLLQVLAGATRIGLALWFSLFTLMPGAPVGKSMLCLAASLAISMSSPATASALSLQGLVQEAVIGVVIGLGLHLVLEWLQMAGQLIALQAGFAYASTIDPSSGVDSGLIPALLRTLGLLLFFALGLDRSVVQLVLRSYVLYPAGAPIDRLLRPEIPLQLLQLASEMALRVALPCLVALLLADIILTMIGRLQPQMQLSALAFPLKLALWPLLLMGAVLATPSLLTRFFNAYLQLMGVSR